MKYPPTTKRDCLALLAHFAYEADCIGEGELADLLGVDRVAARDVLIAGRDLADRREDARKARAESMRAALAAKQADAATIADAAGARAYGVVKGAVERLFADGRERTTGEVATAMQVKVDTAIRRLQRSGVVERVGHGRWRKVAA